MDAKPSHVTLRANGLDHHLLAWGSEAGATALLLHGFMDAAGTWDRVAPRLANEAKLRVLAPDMRGFGDGPRAPAGSYYHFVDYVADLAAIVDQAIAPGEPLFLVGHSMGGTITSYYAGARPERVTKLALLEGVGPPDNPHEASPDRMRRWLDELQAFRPRAPAVASAGDALRRLAMNHPNVDLDVLATRVPHLVKEDGEGVKWRYDPLHRTTAPVPFFAESYVAFARRIASPVLFVSGGASGWHPPDEEARLAAFGRLERRTIDGAGHMMHWTHPDDLAEALVAFWRAGEG